MSKVTEELKAEIAELKDKIDDLQRAVKLLDHDLQATKREMKGN